MAPWNFCQCYYRASCSCFTFFRFLARCYWNPYTIDASITVVPFFSSSSFYMFFFTWLFWVYLCVCVFFFCFVFFLSDKFIFILAFHFGYYICLFNLMWTKNFLSFPLLYLPGYTSTMLRKHVKKTQIFSHIHTHTHNQNQSL